MKWVGLASSVRAASFYMPTVESSRAPHPGLLRRLEQAHVRLRTHPHEARWLAAADDDANDDSGEVVAATGCYNSTAPR